MEQVKVIEENEALIGDTVEKTSIIFTCLQEEPQTGQKKRRGTKHGQGYNKDGVIW